VAKLGIQNTRRRPTK